MVRYLVSLAVVAAVVGCSKPEQKEKPAVTRPTAPPAKKEAAPATEPAAAPEPPPNPTNDAALKACDTYIAEQAIDRSATGWKSRLQEPPTFPFDAAKTYYWVIETNHGTIKVKLMPKVAPMHVSSTIYLSRLGFYDGVVFHRVIPGFMAQGGDPTGTGGGGPGYKYAGEFDDSVRHSKPGLLSMANAGPGTDGSQFFLTFVATPHLDRKHTIFGEIVDGMATLKELERRGSPGGRPTERLVMTRTSIVVE
jgi:cyclophilin family peptidyl-prolyl cis-trans isomerase